MVLESPPKHNATATSKEKQKNQHLNVTNHGRKPLETSPTFKHESKCTIWCSRTVREEETSSLELVDGPNLQACESAVNLYP